MDNALFVHAEDLLADIEERRKYYVQAAGFNEALRILNERRVCVISGSPGVGKTTLAEMLIVRLLEDGYRPLAISEDPAEADQLWHAKEKQVFLYDDFLGQNDLRDKLGRAGDSRLIKLMKRTERSANHFLILTTREYILTAARQAYEKLNSEQVDLAKLIVDMEAYSQFQRAHIFYNHVYFSDLKAAARKSLLEERAYLGIVNHHNYNPRLIRLIIDSALREGGSVAASGFARHVRKSLDDPSRLWQHVFERQLPPTAQDILLVLATLGRLTSVTDLRATVTSYRWRGAVPVDGQRLINEALDILEGVFIDIADDPVSRPVNFANPGIGDYLRSYIAQHSELYPQLLAGALWFEQGEVLLSWVSKSKNPSISGPELTELRRFLGLQPNLLIDFMLSKLETETPELRPVYLPGSQRMHLRVSADVVDRCCTLLRACLILDATRFDEVASRVVALALQNLQTPSRLSLLKLISGLAVVDRANSDVNLLINELRAYVQARLYDAEAYDFLRRLLEVTDPDDLDAEGGLVDEFEDFARSEVQRLLSSSDSDTVAVGFEQLYDAYRGFTNSDNLYSELCQLEDHRNELAEDDKDEVEARSEADSGADDEEAGSQIDALFATLNE